MNLIWNGSWLTVNILDSIEVTTTLKEAGMKEGVNFKVRRLVYNPDADKRLIEFASDEFQILAKLLL